MKSKLPLIYWMAVDLGKGRSDMTVEERIGAADRRKMDGNALYHELNLEEAMQQYEMARAALGQTDAAREDFLKARKYAPKDKAIARELRLLVNMTRLYLQGLTQYLSEEIGSYLFGSGHNNIQHICHSITHYICPAMYTVVVPKF
ncbi:Peptidyl-prolyl cis-trans isomerase FKBP42 [Spatholobus suberectus]|nr:Peptidyl-prolyl cis-trans isomerase FKBP42 [Spatholobus suberectus]